MKRAGAVVVAVAAVAGAGWAGASWYTGKRVEETVRQGVADANKANDWGAKIEIVSYERGILNSTARYRISGLAGTTGDELLLAIDSKVHHGPLPLDRLVKFQLKPVSATTESTLARDEGLGSRLSTVDAGASFRERSVIDTQGNVDFRIDTPAMRFAQDGGTLEVAGGAFTGLSEKEMTHIRVNGTLESVRIVAPVAQQGTVDIRNITISSDNRVGRFGLQIGDGSLRVGSFTIAAATPAGPFALAGSDFVVASHIEEDEKFMSGHVSYNFGKLALNNTDIGAIDARFAVRKLDGATTAKLSESYREFARKPRQPGETDEAAARAAIANLQAPLKDLLTHSPAFALDALTWTTPVGQSSLKVDVTLKPRDTPVERAEVNVPGVAVDRATLDLSVSQPAVIDLIARLTKAGPGGQKITQEQAREQATMVVAMLLGGVSQSGFLTAQGDKVESHIKYDGKTLNVNGQDVPPEMLREILPMFE
ncbi:YdgA family protein [Pigmentiphaga aceris]|nr:YdgA family protein [Pigmentiphaga aceris]